MRGWKIGALPYPTTHVFPDPDPGMNVVLPSPADLMASERRFLDVCAKAERGPVGDVAEEAGDEAWEAGWTREPWVSLT
eukprot:14277586-Alexandrium_andersonii.AAC.1